MTPAMWMVAVTVINLGFLLAAYLRVRSSSRTLREASEVLDAVETSLRMADHWLGHDFIRPGDIVETVADDIRLRAWEHVREALAVIDPDGTAGVADEEPEGVDGEDLLQMLERLERLPDEEPDE